MSHPPPSPAPSRGRGRGKSRGGLGKYLRARGRRGYGRPAEFSKRLVLEGEAPPEDEEETEAIAAENAHKYSRRQLTSNADRYEEREPELGSDGEPIVEPEVDLSAFLEKQKLADDSPGPSLLLPKHDGDDDDDDDIDYSLPLFTSPSATSSSKKGKVEQIEWTEDLDALHREKLTADATRELKHRFRAKSEKWRHRPDLSTPRLQKTDALVEAPPLPLPDGAVPESKDPKAEMEEFLDDLLQ
ncbi:hypothetical protein AX17_005956 [Amanita inopinata Kibby_2008]|nr:hypothetical protein AX17_005956 [Amanita inopinata Kibby_2008]